MSKIYVIIGKSSTGKDTIFTRLVDNEELKLHVIVSYTTRPQREGEEEGREYHFVTEDRMKELESQGKVVEKRTYHTVFGDWHYFLVDDGHINYEKHDYIVIGTLESYEKVKNYFGEDVVHPLYIEVDDGIRLQRALNRENQQEEPHYDEMCRRFLADQVDFSEENIEKLAIKKRYKNDSLVNCLKEIEEDILRK